ncbi:uncharacterized protein LOC124864186 [Girardinichthys multiradiatus]|uniref:uncharacterized protein LOC124862496 n=1 Tax=Girardinichthys multiradiatus TaxID=208333 RepID=UPI001FACD422|nr:uncharacterized protein LOC124862496 [Girardinichthys multiradiatus]XP_047214807.1 uncharacterized protein LOC124864186 [Girardinichthys multiradiatus]
MSDLSDFLRGRGLPEDAISLLEEQKIDWDVIALMDDATLANYIPSYGDRIALFNFCKSKQPLSKRKQGLLQKLREKMKTKKESPKENTSQERTRQTKKQKATRNIEIGWIHTDGKITKQGPETDFEFEVWDFKQNHLTDDTCLTIGNMYEAARLTMLRFYIATKPKVPEEDDSETSEVIFVLESSSSEINPLQTWEVRSSSVDAHPGLEPSDDSEITFGPILNAEEDTEDTLIYEGFLVPLSPANPDDAITITVRHTNTLHDIITAFSDSDIMRKTLNVKRILPDNTEEAGSGSGILRDVLTCFWNEFYERCTLGTTVKVPFIRHDFPAEKWKAVGRILLKGYQDCQYFPNKLAIPFLEQVLFSSVYSDLKAHFLQFVSSQECEVLREAVKNFSAVDQDDLVEVLDSYGCRKRIIAETLPTILDEIAHKELVQKPMFVIDCWREIIYPHISLSPEALIKLFSDLQPTSKKVCQLLKFAEDLSPKQKDVGNHLKRFIRELDDIKLQKFMRFCTGSDLIVTNSIFVEFQDMTAFTRRSVGHTCGSILQIADNYENFPDFRSEFNAVLESNVWVMDIV